MTRTTFLVQNPLIKLEYFKYQAGSSQASEYFPLFFGVVALLILAAAIYRRLSRWQTKSRLQKGRETQKAKFQATEIDLDDTDRERLEELAGSSNPVDLLPLIQSRNAFEERMALFRQNNPDDPARENIPYLRQRLGYGFDNPRTPFNHTRMLFPGTKMNCTIALPQRNVTYTTSIVSSDEESFYILPPKQQGKPVNLSKFPSLSFRVGRHHDAEYNFKAAVLGQNHDGVGAVKIAHSEDIHKQLYRTAPRMELNMSGEFYVIHQEVADKAKTPNLTLNETQFSFKGQFLDLSLGGFALTMPPGPKKAVRGDVVMFRLEEANIKENMSGRVLNIVEDPHGFAKIHCKFTGIREISRLKLSRYLQTLQEQKEAAQPAPPKN